MTREETICAVTEAFARAVSRPVASDFDINRDGPKIADALRAQPEVAVSEYDPTTQAINVTLAPDALGLVPVTISKA